VRSPGNRTRRDGGARSGLSVLFKPGDQGAAYGVAMDTRPFRIDVTQQDLDDLRERIGRTRWPEEPAGAGWTMGADASFMRRLADHWLNRYDWRAHEAALNAHPQFVADVDGMDLHFVHARGKGPDPTPVLLIHSYPDSFYRFLPVVDMLTDPAAHGGDASDSFDVIVPSLPGFGFSAHEPLTVSAGADKLAQLMAGLGYGRYIAGGGDGPVPMAMSQRHADAVSGICVLDVSYPDATTDFASLSEPEVEFANWIQGWWMREGAFNMIQSTKPQSLAFALHDSPVGLAAWLMILFTSGGAEGIEERFSLDGLITNAMIYWVSGSIGSSLRSYFVSAQDQWGPNASPPPPRSDVPAAFARMPLDAPAPREWAERKVNVVQFTEMASGGHWSSWEVPELFAEDLRTFARTLRT
jgi:pimeloyl-ACP methyl ester carboxylesterase